MAQEISNPKEIHQNQRIMLLTHNARHREQPPTEVIPFLVS
jgi:hypothetical protein